MNIHPITPPDSNSIKQARAHQDRLTKPTGALGELEDVACWLAGIQQSNTIRTRPAALVVFAADHPISHHGVSAYPREVTGAMLHNILSGGAASSVLARKQNIPLYLWDVGVDSAYTVPNLPKEIQHYKIDTQGTVGNLFERDAMDEQCLLNCWEAGERSIQHLDSDTKIVLFGEMGIGNTTPASAICAALLDLNAEDIVGAGTGVHGAAMQNKTKLVQKALDRCQDTRPFNVLKALGGREIAAMVAAMQKAAQKGIAIWVDGFIVSAAALLACRINPSIRPYLYFAHRSAEQGHRRVLEALQAKPLIQCGLRLGEGTGALNAFPLLELAVELHLNMATFEQAAVPDREK